MTEQQRPYLSDMLVRKETYEIDIVLLDRYQSFSAEILRVALLALTGYGVLIVYILDTSYATCIAKLQCQDALVIGAASFAASGVLALAHRYFSSDAIGHQIHRSRLLLRLNTVDQSKDDEDKDRAFVERETLGHKIDMKLSGWLLALSCLALAAGTISVVVTFNEIVRACVVVPS